MSGGRRERDVNPDERQLKHFTELNKIRRASTIERLLFTFFPQERERRKRIKIRLEETFVKTFSRYSQVGRRLLKERGGRA